MAEIKNHPLIFTIREVVSGKGFLVGVTVSGRALMVKENDEWWMYGVRPGAIAEGAPNAEEAYARFRTRYREVLFDIAEESGTFDDFRKEVERFFYEPDYEEEQKWEDAVSIARSQCLTTPPAPFAKLPIEAPENRPAQITVERLDGVEKRFMPSDNVSDRCLYVGVEKIAA